MGISWIKLDLSVRSKPEFRAILRKHGVEGGHTYWEILQYMAIQDDGIIHVKNYTYDMLADEFCIDVDTIEEIINDLLLYGLISSNDDKTELWSESVLDDIEAYDKRVNKAKKAADARWPKEDATSICYATRIYRKDMPIHQIHQIQNIHYKTVTTSHHKRLHHKTSQTIKPIKDILTPSRCTFLTSSMKC